MEATGVLSWRNTGDEPQLFDTVFYLVSPVGARYGPLQVNHNISAPPQVPTTQNIRFNTAGLPPGVYSVVTEIYDSWTGMLLTAITLPGRLSIREIAPPVPPPPPPPVVPEVPTIDILGIPSLNLPRQLNVGDVWSGSVSLPTFSTIPIFAEAQLVLRDPQGYEHIVSRPGGRTLQPGETLQIPVNFDTAGFPGGSYTILLRVFDQFGQRVTDFPMGFLSMIEAIAPPLPPVPPVPEIPTTPTADMFGTPSVNLPTELEIGQMWQGDITIPTMVPPALQQLPSLPALPVNIGLQLQDPAGQLFNIGTFPRTFTPGQPISLPVNFDTSVLTQEGMHDLIMNISDIQGNLLFSGPIGFLMALMPAIPPPPAVPLSRFTAIAVEMTPQTTPVGGTVTIPFSYTHVGRAERVILYAAIGDIRPSPIGFDEVWVGQKTKDVPAHAVPTTERDSITIQITEKFLGPGSYAVYAKVTGRWPEVISAYLPNMVEVVVPAVIPRADIADIDFRLLTTGLLDPGDTVSWIMTGVYKGRAQSGSLTIALGLGSFAPIITRFTLPPIPVNFAESTDWAPFTFRGNFTIPVGVEHGLTYSIRARLETFMDPTQETDHDFNVISIAAAPPAPPPPVLPRADIADIDFRILTIGDLAPGDTVSWIMTGVYKGRAQGGSLTISLGTGPLGTFFTRFTLPPISINFQESQDWQNFSFRGNFIIPANIEPGQTYSIRARLEAIEEPTQETDTDWGVIRIAEVAAPPPPPAEFTLDVRSDPLWGGTVSKSPNKPRYSMGEIVQVTAHPVPGRSFDYWTLETGEFLDTANPINFMVMASHTLTAHF